MRRTTPKPEPARELAWQLGPVLVTALTLRLFGLSHGTGFHPDERHTIGVVHAMSWRDLNPHSFAYGSLPYYVLFLVDQVLRPFLGSSYDTLFLRGRALSAVVGTLGVAVTYFLARALAFRREVAWLAAVLLTLTFFHVQNCHFFTVDIWVTTAGTFALWTALRLEARGDRASALWAGTAVGAATAIKITGLSLILPLVAAVAAHHWRVSRRTGWRLLAWAGLAAIASFLIAEPYAVFDGARVLRDLEEQAAMASGAAIRPFTIQYVHTLPWLYPLRQMFWFTLGWPLALAGFGGTLWASFRQWRRFEARPAIVLSWTLVFFGAIGAEHTKFPRYLLPIYPVLAIYGACGLFELERWLKGRLPSGWAAGPRLAVVGFAFVFTVAHLQPYSRPHTWLTASRWILHEFPHGAKTVSEAWDDSLPTGVEPTLFPSAGTLPLYEPEDDARLDTIVKMLSEAELMALPTARVYGSILQAPEMHPQSARYYRLLFAGQLGYERLRIFKLRPSFGPWEWDDDLADESLSVYTHPKVVIFRNRDHLPANELRSLIGGQQYDGGLTREQVMTLRNEWE